MVGNELWETDRGIRLRDEIRPLSEEQREKAVRLFGNNLETWVAYLNALEAADLEKLCQTEMLMFMRLNMAPEEARSEISSPGGINEVVAAEIKKTESDFGKTGYSLLRDFGAYGSGYAIRIGLLNQLRNNHSFTTHPLPHYMGISATNVILKDSDKPDNLIQDYVRALEEATKQKNMQESNEVKIITLHEAAMAMARHYTGLSMRDAMTKAVVGLAYGGSPAMEGKYITENPFSKLPFIEFADRLWKDAMIPYDEPKALYPGPFWVLNDGGVTGRHIAQLKWTHFKLKSSDHQYHP